VELHPQPVRRLHIGTSGWYYADWRGNFYPEGLAKAHWFAHYTSVFGAVELNSTFYHLPRPELFRAWAERAPAGFRYAVKAPRDLTHGTDADPQALLQGLAAGARVLGEHLGPILYQLPPSFHRDLDGLRSLLGQLPPELDHVIEFRHASWYTDDVRALLTEKGVGFCIQDMHGSASPWWVTGPTAYVRLHGPGRPKYAGHYGSRHLRQLARALTNLEPSACAVYVFFNNTIEGAGAEDARALQEMLARDCSEGRDQGEEDKSQRSEDRSQKTEDRSQRTEITARVCADS
jgi:uncharacterized protein YecE (DUF72 family)